MCLGLEVFLSIRGGKGACAPTRFPFHVAMKEGGIKITLGPSGAWWLGTARKQQRPSASSSRRGCNSVPREAFPKMWRKRRGCFLSEGAEPRVWGPQKRNSASELVTKVIGPPEPLSSFGVHPRWFWVPFSPVAQWYPSSNLLLGRVPF